MNFRRVAAVLGQEMTHGFDRLGKQHDKDGNPRNWWQPADAAAFRRKARRRGGCL